MGVKTAYADMRDDLRDKLKECEVLAREMLNEDIWGYDDMRKDYAVEIYLAVRNVKDMV